MSEAELKLAKQLIDQIASETFDPTQYHDEVRERIQADIEKKVQGQDITEAAEPSAEPARIIDLMAALKASLGKGKAGAAGGARGGRRPRGVRRAEASRRGAQKSLPRERRAEARPQQALTAQARSGWFVHRRRGRKRHERCAPLV